MSVPGYAHGHDATVLAAHRWRNIENSAAFIIPYLNASTHLLDVGCGPGSITLDFAVRCGSVVGLDPSADTIAQAKSDAMSLRLSNITFMTGDGYKLPFQDDEFDVTYCHQVLQHVSDPVALLKEMKRVTKRQGIVAAREGDYDNFCFHPLSRGIQDWTTLMQKIFKANGGEANAGRYMLNWFVRAGWPRDDLQCSCSTWIKRTLEERRQWGASWAKRILHSNNATVALEKGYATKADLEYIAQAWLDWTEDENALGWMTSMEVIAKKD